MYEIFLSWTLSNYCFNLCIHRMLIYQTKISIFSLIDFNGSSDFHEDRFFFLLSFFCCTVCSIVFQLHTTYHVSAFKIITFRMSEMLEAYIFQSYAATIIRLCFCFHHCTPHEKHLIILKGDDYYNQFVRKKKRSNFFFKTSV